MNFFLLYVSLPALLFGIMSKTPFEELNNPPFLIAHQRDVADANRPAGVSVGSGIAAASLATKARGPRAWPVGEAARSNRSDACRPRAAQA
jgi:hypothetical protein